LCYNREGCVHFQVKLYNDHRNAQVFNLSINLILPYMFRAFFQPIFRGRCTTSAWIKSPGCVTLVIIQFHSKMHAPYNLKFEIVSLVEHIVSIGNTDISYEPSAVIFRAWAIRG
jgi:hypothetical protein